MHCRQLEEMRYCTKQGQSLISYSTIKSVYSGDNILSQLKIYCEASSRHPCVKYQLSWSITVRVGFTVHWVMELLVVLLCRGSRWRLCRWENPASVLGASGGRGGAVCRLLVFQPLRGRYYHRIKGDEWTCKRQNTDQVHGSMILVIYCFFLLLHISTE